MSVRGSFLGGASRIPAREDLRCRRHETAPRARRFGSARSDPGRTPSIAAAAAFDVLVLLGAPEDRASGAFAFGRGLDFPPFLIDPRRPFVRLRPRACMLVSGGVGTPDQ